MENVEEYRTALRELTASHELLKMAHREWTESQTMVTETYARLGAAREHAMGMGKINHPNADQLVNAAMVNVGITKQAVDLAKANMAAKEQVVKDVAITVAELQDKIEAAALKMIENP